MNHLSCHGWNWFVFVSEPNHSKNSFIKVYSDKCERILLNNNKIEMEIVKRTYKKMHKNIC